LEGYSIIVIAIIGLVFGSFLAMLVYRLPLEISLFTPKRSVTPCCKNTIKWYENIPLFSYIALKGKCSNCKSKISLYYPIIEVMTLVITLGLYIKFHLSFEFLLLTILFYTLLVLSFIDLRYKAVPDYLLVFAMLVLIIYILIYKQTAFFDLILFIGGIVLIEFFLTFYIQNIKAKILKDKSLKEQKSLGEGDIPIVGIIGALLGVQLGMFAIFLAAILAIIPSLLNRIIKKDIETPFIPYLSLGLCIVFFNEAYFENIIKGILQS